ADDGAAVLVFGRQAKGHPQVLKAVQRAVDGTWKKPVTIAAESSYPQLAVDGAGGAVVVYTPNFNRVEAVSMSAAGQWGQGRFLSPRGVEVRDYDLAMNGAGTALVAVARGNGRVDLVRRSPRGAWSSPARVVAGGTTLYDVVVGLDDARDTFLGWGGYALSGRYRPHADGWGATKTLSPDSGVDVLEATFAEVAPNGDVVVMWEQEARPLKVRVRSAS
ncbi:MAG: hypothetical protein JWO76_613, partial [Nocardioides sp.]|nr:hypothetical protein [Nocardioides sp.]